MVNFIEGVQEKVIAVVLLLFTLFVGVYCCLPVSVCRVDICCGVYLNFR